MAREDWDLSHEYETHDHHGDDDREWFLEVVSHAVLFLAAIGLFTLAPYILGFVGFVLAMAFGLMMFALKLVAGVLGLCIGAVGFAVGLVLKAALFAVSLIAHPAVLLLVILIALAAQRRN